MPPRAPPTGAPRTACPIGRSGRSSAPREVPWRESCRRSNVRSGFRCAVRSRSAEPGYRSELAVHVLDAVDERGAQAIGLGADGDVGQACVRADGTARRSPDGPGGRPGSNGARRPRSRRAGWGSGARRRCRDSRRPLRPGWPSCRTSRSLSPGVQILAAERGALATVRRIQMMGEPQRTISSTPVGEMPAGSACHRARWSGCSAKARSPWLMALRVVSLPAIDQQDEKGRHFGGRERLTVDVAVDEGRGDVIGRVAPARLGQVRHQRGECLRSLHQRHQRDRRRRRDTRGRRSRQSRCPRR